MHIPGYVPASLQSLTFPSKLTMSRHALRHVERRVLQTEWSRVDGFIISFVKRRQNDA